MELACSLCALAFAYFLRNCNVVLLIPRTRLLFLAERPAPVHLALLQRGCRAAVQLLGRFSIVNKKAVRVHSNIGMSASVRSWLQKLAAKNGGIYPSSLSLNIEQEESRISTVELLHSHMLHCKKVLPWF